MPDLLPFPVDDFMLDQIEHALAGGYECDSEGQHVLVGADFTLTQLLDFLSGYDAAKLVPDTNQYDTPDPTTDVYPDPLYTPRDVILALIAEVRRLRAA